MNDGREHKPAGLQSVGSDPESGRLSREVSELRERERQAVSYVRDKTNQLLEVMGTSTLRPEELDDETLFTLDPLGIVGEAFGQVLDHLQQTNAQLLLARDEIRAIFDAVGAAILVVDRAGRIVAGNARSQEFFASGGSLQGCRCHETVCRRPAPPASCLLQRIFQGGGRREEADFVRDDRHFHVVGSAVAGDGEQPAQVALVYTDITQRRRMEQDLRDTRQRLETILTSVHAGILLIEADSHRIVEANELALRMIGADREDVLGARCHRFICPASCGECPITDGGQMVDNAERWLLRADGGQVPVLKTVTCIELEGRQHLLESFIDLSQRKQAEAALRASEERYRSLYVHMHEGVALCELVGEPGQPPGDYRILDVNPAYARLLDRPREELVGRLGSELSGLPVPPHIEVFARVAAGGQSASFESACAVPDRQVHVSVFSPAADRFAAVFEDITDRKRAQQEMERLAYFDALTGLPNRSLFRDRLDQALSAAARSDQHLALMFLDLDQFKEVNDTFGHAAGDRLLQLIAGRLSAAVRKSDTVARLGGDEFVVILGGVDCDQDVAVLGQKLLEALSLPIDLEEREIFITGSLGITLYPHDGDDAETLIRNADAAMYQAKERGNTCQFYTSTMNAQTLERLLLGNDLRKALDREEFLLHYQPIVDGASGRILGVEALLRWQHPELGLLQPSHFIPLAEETGLIVPLGHRVLETACERARAWQDAGLPPVTVAVNLSARQFREPGLAAALAGILDRWGLEGGALELEITETVLLDDLAATRKLLAELKGLGVGLAIDDFGTGYSSLSYLRRFPIDRLKIDRSFMHDIPAHQDGGAIVEAIIALGRSLGLKVLAEGVETAAQKDFLLARGCREMQGFYFDRPLPEAELLARRRRGAAD